MGKPAKDLGSEHSDDVDNSVQKVTVSENEIDITETKSQSIVIGTTSSSNESASIESQRRLVNNSQQHVEVMKNKISIKGSTAEDVCIGITGGKRNLN